MKKFLARFSSEFNGTSPIDRKANVFILLFFAFVLGLGILVVDDYGISVDENFAAHKADLNYEYLTGNNDDLLSYDDRHYGVILTLPLRFISQFIPDSRADMTMRHMATFLVFFISGIYVYHLLRKLAFNRWYAILGTAIYYFHPHLFSHAFYNIKDIPFAALFAVNLYTLQLLLEKRSPRFAFLHGIYTGMLIVFRVPGTLMVASTAMLGIWLLILEPRKWKNILSIAAVYLVAALAALVFFMPSLWHDPLGEINIMFSMDLIEWPHKEIFMGQLIPGVSIPRIYLPVYFAVTAPLLYLGLAALGTFVLLFKLFISKQILNPARLGLSLPFFGFYFPVMVIMITRPILYNGWRHAFFIYPAFVLLVVYGAKALIDGIRSVRDPRPRRSVMALFLVLAGWQLVEQVRFFVVSHPYEHVYYNRIAGESLSDARRSYAMDYWGLAYKEALEEILKIDDRDQIRVLGYHPLLVENNLAILPAADRERIVVAQKGEPYDYFIQHFRNDFQEEFPNRQLIYSIRVDGALINAVYKFTGDQ